MTDSRLLRGSYPRDSVTVSAARLGADEQLDAIIGCAPGMRDLFDRLRRVAPSEDPSDA